jgi:hypothetical protein
MYASRAIHAALPRLMGLVLRVPIPLRIVKPPRARTQPAIRGKRAVRAALTSTRVSPFIANYPSRVFRQPTCRIADLLVAASGPIHTEDTRIAARAWEHLNQ